MSIALLLLDTVKSWLNIRVNNITLDGEVEGTMTTNTVVVQNLLAVRDGAGFLTSDTVISYTGSQTMNGSDVFAGIVKVDTSGGAANLTLPLASGIIAAGFGGALIVGDVAKCLVTNAGGNAITLLANTGTTLVGGNSIPANTSRYLAFRITNVGTPAVSVY